MWSVWISHILLQLSGYWLSFISNLVVTEEVHPLLQVSAKVSSLLLQLCSLWPCLALQISVSWTVLDVFRAVSFCSTWVSICTGDFETRQVASSWTKNGSLFVSLDLVF